MKWNLFYWMSNWFFFLKKSKLLDNNIAGSVIVWKLVIDFCLNSFHYNLIFINFKFEKIIKFSLWLAKSWHIPNEIKEQLTSFSEYETELNGRFLVFSFILVFLSLNTNKNKDWLHIFTIINFNLFLLLVWKVLCK